MKKNIILIALLLVLPVIKAECQEYLPLTGGTLNGNLTISSSYQLQTPYLGFGAPTSQPSNSSNVALFPNPSTITLDIVGWGNGWRFIPNNGSLYPSPVATIDAAGNTFVNGNFGIGTNSPSSQLAITGFSSTNPNNTGAEITYCAMTFQNTNSAGQSFNEGRITAIQENGDYLDAGAMAFSTGVAGLYERMRINTSGNLLIGKTTQQNSAYKLDVNGSIRSNAIVVNTTGADFVFGQDYQLPSLTEVGRYISLNHHLPGIASAAEMQKNGLDLGDNQIKLLQKVEELTLYLIDKNKQISQQQQQMESYQQQLSKQEAQINQLQECVRQLMNK